MITGMQKYRVARRLLIGALVLCSPTLVRAGTVSNLNDSGAGSLRSTVAAGGTVTFAVTGTIALTSGPIGVPNGVIISGPGADQLQVSGSGSSQIFIVASAATAQISGLTLTDGNAGTGGQGGAIYNQGTLSLTGMAISANSAGDSGGGVYNAGTLVIRATTLNGNSVGDATCAGGGAIRSEGTGSSLSIVNSTISGNSAAACSGGGISFNDGTTIIVSSTVDANSAGLSGGNVYKGSTAAAVTLRNAIISAGTTGGGTPTNPDLHGAVGGGLTSLGYNLVQTRGDGTGYAASDLPGGTDPSLAALANYSGPTNTQALQSTSPAIDAVPTASCLDLDGSSMLVTDQRGVTRPQGIACDIGAFEVRQSAFSVSVNGSGTVSASDPTPPISGGIASCTSSGGANCSAVYSGDPTSQVTLTATPTVGYSFTGWGGDCSGTSTCNLMTDQPHSATATFAITTYTVTPSAGANGTISPNTPQTVNYNGTTTFTVTPNTGYTASVGGTCGGSLVGTTYTTNAITTNCTVVASFAINTYTVTPSAGANGTISPNTPQTVNYNGTTTFTVTPNTGYTASVGGTCGGSLVGTTYTTNAITTNCTVVASFAINTYTVTPSAGANGTISPNTPQTVNYNGTTTFTVTPNTGYTASVGGTCGGSLVGTTYTTNAITTNCTVVASFAITTYTVTPSAGANGTISPNTPQTVNYNGTTTFTVTPNTGYTASVGGTCGGSLVGTTYTTNAITTNCTVVASFAINTYTVTPSAGANGTISPNTPQTVNYNGTTTFTVTPNTGYTASVGGTCGGSLVGTTYTTNAITTNCTVVASFAITTYTVTPSAGANGTISPNTPQTVNYNGTTTFTVTPNTGYTASVGGTCGGSLVGTTYTTNAITTNCTVVASFAINTYTVTPSAGANGTISPNTPQTVNYNGTTTFTVTPNTGYTASVGGTCGGSLVGTTYTTNAITTNCTVSALFNALPVATAQSVTVVYDHATPITLFASGGPVVFAIITNPINGSISNFDPNAGTLIYTPAAGYSGPDSFSFTATNAAGTSQPATVSITVQPHAAVQVVPTPTLDWRLLLLLALAVVIVAMRTRVAGWRD